MPDIHSQFLCIQCTKINEESSKDPLRCSMCGHAIDVREYAQIYVAAHRSIVYGFHYRQKFAEQYSKNGRITTYYELAPPEGWYVFCAMAAIAGIVGNLAYDVVKAAIKRIWKQRVKPDPDCFPTGLDLLKDSDITIFLSHIKEFQSGLTTLAAPIREAVIREINLKAKEREIIKLMITATKNKSDDSSKRIAKILAEILSQTEPSSRLGHAIHEAAKNLDLTYEPTLQLEGSKLGAKVPDKPKLKKPGATALKLKKKKTKRKHS